MVKMWLVHIAPQQSAHNRCVQSHTKQQSEYQTRFSCSRTWHNSKFNSESCMLYLPTNSY